MSVIISSTPPNDSLCITNYVINFKNITEGNTSYTYNTATNTTIMTVSDLTQGAEYSFSVAGVDAKGGIGNKNMSAETVTLDSEWKAFAISVWLRFMHASTLTSRTIHACDES